MKTSTSRSNTSGSDNSPMLYFLLAIILWLLVGVTSAQVKTTSSNGNWNNPAVWSPYGVPTSSDKIFIHHTITLNQNFTPTDTIFVFNVLNITSGKVLTLNSGIMVLVNTENYNGQLGTIGTDANIVGNFIFQKWITRCDGFSTYGSPFNALTGDFSWYYCNQCMPSWSNLYYYNEAVQGALDNGFYDNIGGNIQRGKGFFYWYSNYQGGLDFSRQISLKGTIDFTTDFDFGITKTSIGNGNSDDGYNLISNPFPGTIDWLSSSWTKRRVLNATYVWNSCTSSYASYVGGVGVNGGSRYIPSMQGFWVQATRNNPQLKISSAAMVNTSQSLLKSSSVSDSIPRVLRLSLSGDEIAVRLDPNSTLEQDSLTDASKFFSEGSFICSSVKSSTLDYAINSVNDTDVVISIKTRGAGTIDFKGASDFEPEYTIYFKDLSTNASQSVNDEMHYTFTDTSLITFQKKFELHFVKNNLTSIKKEFENGTTIRYDDERVYIKLPEESQLPATVFMYDLSGLLIYSTVVTQVETTIPKSTFPAVLRIQGQNGSMARKIF